MLDLKTCKTVLNQGDEQYTDEQIKQISELLWQWAELSVETYLLNQNNQDETSNTDGKGEL